MRIGSLFSGYGGLDMAVQDALGGELAWVSDIEPGPCAILAHHHPDVPNLGDITTVDWTAVEPVDIICGGSPCQDLSHAGARRGMRAGTRSGLWASMCDAIETIRPRFVVWENVKGALSAGADSDMGPCDFDMGCEGPVPLRALGRVLGDLAELGYDAEWVTLGAGDIGAPHRRERVFVLAWDAVPYAEREGRGAARNAAAGEAARGRASAEPRGSGGAPVVLLPTPATVMRPNRSMSAGATVRPSLEQIGQLLPTPTVNDAGNSAGASQFDRNSLPLTHVFLPTPRATDGTNGGPNQRGSSGDLMLPSAVATLADDQVLSPLTAMGGIDFGDYAPAIARWEALTRPAPPPTEPTGKNGTHRLSPAFVEWMMGLPAGHVTGVPGVTRNHQLRALGNGVVPAQAAAALRQMLTHIDQEEAA